MTPMHAEAPRPGYVTIWIWLVVLLAVGMLFFEIEISKTTATMLIFAVAVVKATLVVRHYMHMKAQPKMLYVIACVPLLLAIAMVLSLMPDIAFRK
jgi:caa(3)-type oxidase subunit IV